MTQGYCKGIGSIQIFRIQIHFQCLLNHDRDLFLGCSTIAADGDLGLSRYIFSDWNTAHYSCSNCSSLSSAELQDYLSVLSVERRLYSQFVRLMLVKQFSYSGKDIGQLLKRVLYLAEIKDSHIDIMRAFGINGNDPVT